MADLLRTARGIGAQLALPGSIQHINGETIVDGVVVGLPLSTNVVVGRALGFVAAGATPTTNTSGGSATTVLPTYGVSGYLNTVAASATTFAGVCGLKRDLSYNTISNDNGYIPTGEMVPVVKRGVVFVENAGSVAVAAGAQVWVGNQGEFYGGSVASATGAPASASITSLTGAFWTDAVPAAQFVPYGPAGTTATTTNYSVGKINLLLTPSN